MTDKNMGFLNYLLLGTLAFASGWAIRIYILDKKASPSQPYHLKHPLIIKYLAGFFVIMLGVSWTIGHFILNHQSMDWAFILVNSVVATFVFSFGLNPDTNTYDVPD